MDSPSSGPPATPLLTLRTCPKALAQRKLNGSAGLTTLVFALGLLALGMGPGALAAFLVPIFAVGITAHHGGRREAAIDAPRLEVFDHGVRFRRFGQTATVTVSWDQIESVGFDSQLIQKGPYFRRRTPGGPMAFLRGLDNYVTLRETTHAPEGWSPAVNRWLATVRRSGRSGVGSLPAPTPFDALPARTDKAGAPRKPGGHGKSPPGDSGGEGQEYTLSAFLEDEGIPPVA